MAQVDIKAKNVIKIDPEGKYVISFSGPPPTMADIAEVRRWWNDPDDHVLFMPDSFKLVRVDESESEESEPGGTFTVSVSNSGGTCPECGQRPIYWFEQQQPRKELRAQLPPHTGFVDDNLDDE